RSIVTMPCAPLPGGQCQRLAERCHAEQPVPRFGHQGSYLASTVDDERTAVFLGRPVTVWPARTAAASRGPSGGRVAIGGRGGTCPWTAGGGGAPGGAPDGVPGPGMSAAGGRGGWQRNPNARGSHATSAAGRATARAAASR